MRRTKIVCTLGPATDDIEVMKELIRSGMDVARLNFSHGTYKDHEMRMNLLKQARSELGSYTALLLDTKGPEIRIGQFLAGAVELKEGQLFTLTTRDILGDESQVSVTYQNLPQEVHVGDRILIDDGLIELVVEKTNKTDICCVVKNGGRVSDRKGVNLPGITIGMPYMSQRDREDIIFGIGQEIDFVAASFVRNAFDVWRFARF